MLSDPWNRIFSIGPAFTCRMGLWSSSIAGFIGMADGSGWCLEPGFGIPVSDFHGLVDFWFLTFGFVAW
jgi:hypothetical protein